VGKVNTSPKQIVGRTFTSALHRRAWKRWISTADSAAEANPAETIDTFLQIAEKHHITPLFVPQGGACQHEYPDLSMLFLGILYRKARTSVSIRFMSCSAPKFVPNP
jgi:hypothetical protein